MNTFRNLMLSAAIAVVGTAVSIALPPAGVVQGSTTPTVSATIRPFPTAGTVPVVTVQPSESSVRSSGASADSREEKSHDDSVNAPYGDAERVRAEALIIASNAAKVQKRQTSALVSTAAAKKKPKPKPPIYIKGYSYCGSKVSQAQHCIDQGKLTLYYPSGVKTLAGHNYKGWYWIDDIPTGRIVKIKTGALKGTYKVYGHAKVYNKKFPKSGLGASVALQTCEDSGIGFSFLRRV